MKITHSMVLVFGLSVLSSPVLAQDRTKDVPSWEASAERDVKAGKIKHGVLKLTIENVSRVQQALVAKGHVIKEIDGTINKDTKEALKKFQAMNRFDESGEIDIPTLRALGFGVAVMIATDVKGTDFARSEMSRATGETTVVKAGMPVDVNVNGKGDQEPLGYVVLGKDEIKALQKRLKADSYYAGDTDGAMSSELIVGIRTLQTAKAIKTVSLIDLQTLALVPEIKIEVILTAKLDPRAPGESGK